MMTLKADVEEALRRVRAASTDLHDVEVKTARGGAPKSLPESISALVNGAGGIILLGIDEAAGFVPVAIDARAIAVAVANACSDLVEPAIRAVMDIVEVDGVPIVACSLPALASSRKPCFVKTQGLERGSYIRGHDGDRHLTTYEIHALLSGRGQPREDCLSVPEATIADLDTTAVARLLARLRRTRGPVFTIHDDTTILRMIGVVSPQSNHPTLAGLLALGSYPQQFFPQLDVTFVQYPTTDARPLPDGTRFLDSLSIDGSIPEMVELTQLAMARNMTRRAVVGGIGRKDVWEYPVEAVRELVVNAIMHRDYHPLAQGAQIRVEMYPDRLTITSPGGLYGVVDPETLMHTPITSSRNNTLGKLLEDVELPNSARTVAENRGSGLVAVSSSLREAEMPPARITTTLSHFVVELHHRQGDLDGMTRATSRPEISLTTGSLTPRQTAVLAMLGSDGRTSVELSRELGISRQAVLKHLTALERAGHIKPDSDRRSKGVRWRRVASRD